MSYHSGIIISDSHGRRPTFHKSADERGRFIAAEMEIAESDEEKAYLIDDALSKWDAIAVTDGSLPGTGYEINTAPAQGDMFDKEIAEICGALKKARAKVTRNCGLHVHIDGRDLTFLGLKRILMTYIAVENDLFSMIARSRGRNHFCQKSSQVLSAIAKVTEKATSKEFQEAIELKLYGTRGENSDYYKRDKWNSNRYMALNIHSWFFRKTLEFRHHQGTANALKVIAWARICETLMEFGNQNKEEEIVRWFKDNPQPLASILSPTLKQYFLDRKEYFSQRT